MFNTPTDCYNYIIENDLEMSVLGAMMNFQGHSQLYNCNNLLEY